jgi:hypothetical protein
MAMDLPYIVILNDKFKTMNNLICPSNEVVVEHHSLKIIHWLFYISLVGLTKVVRSNKCYL